MFSGVSFKSISFNPVSFKGLTGGGAVLVMAEFLRRRRRY